MNAAHTTAANDIDFGMHMEDEQKLRTIQEAIFVHARLLEGHDKKRSLITITDLVAPLDAFALALGEVVGSVRKIERS